ncbi:MAG TPA: hypothetical protein ENK85_02600 [Saprospiraceae bacterium]|nr:hypothetical protein [Saprospiraceae bacterium]
MTNQYLINAHTLAQSNIEDMKALLITYPYCSLFRVMALLKAKEEGHPLEKDWLETTSMYVPDRAYLFQIYRNGLPAASSEQSVIRRTTLKPISPKFRLKSEDQHPPLPKTSFSSWNATRTKPLENTEPIIPISPLPEKGPATRPEAKKPKEEKQTEQVAAQLAAKSVAKDEEIISETLAKIMAQQGKKDHAIDIYLKLSLKFPKKKAYFADQIDKLTKKG